MIGNIEAGVRELLEEFLDTIPADPLATLTLGEVAEEIALELEERFGIGAVNPAELRTISAIVALVQKRASAQKRQR
jgi:hypothetical protein